MIPIAALSLIKNIFNKKTLPFILALSVGLLVFLNINSCNKLKYEKLLRQQDKSIFDQNIEAFMDTIRTTYNKTLDTYEHEKKLYLTTLEELQKFDSSLTNKINSIKGDIINVIDTKIKMNNNDILIDNELKDYGDSSYGLKWDFPYKDRDFEQYLSGVSKFRLIDNNIIAGKTFLDSNYLSLNITYGFKELDNKYKVWALCSSPKINITELNGAYFIDKPPPYTPQTFYRKRWIMGPYIGYGVNFDNKFQDPRLGMNFGLSIQYHLFGWGKKP